METESFTLSPTWSSATHGFQFPYLGGIDTEGVVLFPSEGEGVDSVPPYIGALSPTPPPRAKVGGHASPVFEHLGFPVEHNPDSIDAQVTLPEDVAQFVPFDNTASSSRSEDEAHSKGGSNDSIDHHSAEPYVNVAAEATHLTMLPRHKSSSTVRNTINNHTNQYKPSYVSATNISGIVMGEPHTVVLRENTHELNLYSKIIATTLGRSAPVYEWHVVAEEGDNAPAQLRTVSGDGLKLYKSKIPRRDWVQLARYRIRQQIAAQRPRIKGRFAKKSESTPSPVIEGKSSATLVDSTIKKRKPRKKQGV